MKIDNQKLKIFIRLSAIPVISSCFILGLIAVIFIYNLQPPTSTNGQSVTLDIPEKLGFNEIVKKLSASGLIRSEKAFKVYCLITGRAHRFKPGRYFFPINKENALSGPALSKILTEGPKKIAVTIFPGMTLKEIDDRLSSLKIIEPGALINFDVGSLKNDYWWLPFKRSSKSEIGKNSGDILEGFLLPDTYYFLPAAKPDLTIKKILDNFKLKTLPLIDNDADILDTIILASLLEKEIPDNKEKAIAAGILKKRLSAGMALQVDATLIYAKCRGRFLGCPTLTLTREDYKIDSAYNTYLKPGLPPGPISNPSLETIKAAAAPLKTAYWYYLSDPKTKKTIFSKSLKEHNRKRIRYLGI